SLSAVICEVSDLLSCTTVNDEVYRHVGNGSVEAPEMPDHDTNFHLNRQTKRRRVDIGVKRIVSSSASSTQTASAIVTVTSAAKSTVIFDAMNSHQSKKQDVLECQGAQLGEAKSNVLRKLLKRGSSYEDNMIPFSGATIITNLLKSNKAMRGTGGRESVIPRKAEPELVQEDTCSNSSQESSEECLSPFGKISLDHLDSERLNEEHLRAKRARVENIIRGINHLPNVMATSISSGKDCERELEEETNITAQSVSPRESNRENKRKQKLPQQQQHSFQQMVSTHKQQKVEERRQLKLQLEDMQKQLKQLQEKFFQIYDSTDSEADGGTLSEDSARSNGMLGDGGISEYLIQNSVADRSDNEIADLDPRCFLDEANSLHREQVLLDGEMAKQEGSLRNKGLMSMHEAGKRLAKTLKQELNSAMSQVVDTVVNVFSKPPQPPLQVFPSLPANEDHFAFNGDNPNFHTANERLQCFGDVIFPSPLDPFVGVRLPRANDQTEALPLEGLSPNHLKKAKLMFFYTRYPSSSMLKIYFSDVKFNRCITSQLIKWFSNFREFYYIQMEKFARQAINNGVAAVDDIIVSRDSELYKVLNMHYNKANDFEVCAHLQTHTQRFNFG
ncbi:hypothetical protein cypCar_00018582, partial [Cyprinus carpio]